MIAPLRVMLSGGGTGGHVYPALTVVAAAQAAGRAAEFEYVGSSTGLESGIVAKTKLPFESIDAGAFRGRSPIAALKSVVHNVRGGVQAIRLLRRFRTDVVLATGGYVCVPVVLAARIVGVPSVVYLPDLRPGWAVRFLARFATVVAVSFDEVAPHVTARRVAVTGYPVRAELGSWDPTRAREFLGIPDGSPIVLVLGGSRGARSINEAMLAGATAVASRAYVIHATGPLHIDAMRERLAHLPDHVRERYRLYPYLESEMAPALAAASIVIARAGASVLGELPRVGAPSILVPGTFAGGHQSLNADFLAGRGAAVVVHDDDLPRGELVRCLLGLLDDSERLGSMAESSRRLSHPDAALALFDLVDEVGRHRVANAQLRRTT
jgi:UDP-N-acetylglucosamine--N-acetylmuramyl-(pentapeptide) pyrophosphoryl-undecaprenol N-acetylglucosamine transferase